jgi:hypothetical protein
VGNYICFGNWSSLAHISEVPNDVPVYIPAEWDNVLADIAALELEPL